MKIRNLKIGTRLVIVFSIITVVVIGNTVYNIVQIDSLKSMNSELFQKNIKSIDFLLEADRDVYQSRLALIEYIKNGSLEKSESFETEIIENIEQVKTRYFKYADLYNVTEEGNFMKQHEIYELNYPKLLKATDEIIECIKRGDINVADSLYANNYTTYFDNLRESLNLSTEILLTSADEDSQFVISSVAKTMKVILLASLIFLLIVIIGGIVITRSIIGPLRQLMLNAKQIAEGDLNIQIDNISNDEIGELTVSVKEVVSNLQNFTNEMTNMSELQFEGEIDAQIPIDNFKGVYRKMVEGVNQNLKQHIDNILMILDIVNSYAKGNFEPVLKKLPGKQAIANESLDLLRKNLLKVMSELNLLIEDSKAGKLKSRANIENFEGDWKKIMIGINDMLQEILNPIQESNRVLNQISKGNIKEKVELELKGEHKDMQNAVNNVQLWLNGMVDKIKLIAQGNLSLEIKKLSGSDELSETLQQMVYALQNIVTEVNVAAGNVATGSSQMSESSNVIASGANEQASSTEEISASFEQMLSSIKNSLVNAEETEKKALKAAKDIRLSSEKVYKTQDAMTTIVEKISIISDIAEKTDLLAINAAIEAARAGKHGEGFAVVAAEVRKLAEQSQEAAVEINQVSKDSVAIAEESGQQLKEVVPNIEQTAELVRDLVLASKEQEVGIEHVKKAMSELSSVTQQNTSNAEELATGSEELASQAEQLEEVMSFFYINSDNNKKQNKLKKKSKNQLTVNDGMDNYSMHKSGFKEDEFENF